MVKIKGGSTKNMARVDPSGKLMVCVCGDHWYPTLEDLLKMGWEMQLFTEVDDEIVPLKQVAI